MCIDSEKVNVVLLLLLYGSVGCVSLVLLPVLVLCISKDSKEMRDWQVFRIEKCQNLFMYARIGKF